MRIRRIMAIGVVGAMGLAGCDEAVGPEAGPQGLKVTVAPLNLQGIDYACYDILVENQGAAYKAVGGGNDVVVLGDPTSTGGDAASGAICSNQYGNIQGGDISYVAPCDASPGADTGTADGVQNRVTIWVDGLYRGGVDVSTNPSEAWQDPCPTGCAVDFDCNENEDTLVEFNFTIMRNANQGFFDVAVNFEDVFCSAKVDCQYSNGQWIRLVHDQSGQRTFTVVAAVACTGGDAGAEDGLDARTQLYASDVTVACTTGQVITTTETTPISPAGEGNFWGVGDARPNAIEQAMVFRGLENLVNGATGADADKMYWNVAIGFTESDNSTPAQPDVGVGDFGYACSLSWKVAPSKGLIEDVFAQANVTYPYIQMTVPISDLDGTPLCSQHPVNGGNGVSTVYTPLGTSLPEDFSWHQYQTQTVGGSDVEAWPTGGGQPR